jgi:hypothetical protein
MRKRRAIALLRVSSNAQDVQRQRTDIERVRRKFDLDIVETLELDGVSGRRVLQDPRFVRVLDGVKRRGDVDGLALSAIDRFFRTDRYSDTGIFQPLADARKLIWSAREGDVEPWTDSGFDTCMTAALKSGAEWRELRRRTMDGKEDKRREKKHVSGAKALPRGVSYDKATQQWSYQEPDCSRVLRMCELLLAGDSLHTIAAKVGGGWTYQGVRKTLRNPIWAFGTRVYPAGGTREETYEVRVIDKPLIAIRTWEAIQRELDLRKDRWRKTKKPPRFMLSGLLRCSCGKPWYVRSHSRKNAHDYYYCSTQFKGRGTSCGARSIQQKAADAFVAKQASECFTDMAVLGEILKAIAEPSATSQTSAKEAARLEGRRERILEQRADGLITREKCNQQIAAIDRELQAARAMVSVPAPAINLKRLAAVLVRTFAGFHKKAFEFQRDLLREAVRDIIVENGTILRFTFRGGFLGRILEGANLLSRC